MLAYGPVYMAQIVRNAQALGAALSERGIPILGSHKGYTATHQVIADVRQFGGGSEVSQRLERANIISNKNLIPADKAQDRDNPGGIRMGTVEITRLGMHEREMETVADFIGRVLVERVAPEEVRKEVIAFKEAHHTLYYCIENGVPS
jgi:glycine hydroxymethyltransferase